MIANLLFVLLPILPQGTEKTPGPRVGDDVKAMIGQLGLPNRVAYFGAVDGLSAAGARALPYLLSVIRDERSRGQVRLGALLALRGMGPTAAPALPDVEKLLDSETAMLRLFSLQVIDAVGDRARSLYDKVRLRFEDEDMLVRGLAYRVAARLTTDRKGLLPVLGAALDGKVPTVQSMVLEALDEFYGEAALPLFDKILARFLSDDGNVRDRAIKLAGKMGAEAVKKLCAIARGDERPDLRTTAIHALGHARPIGREQITTLIRVLREEHAKRELRNATRLALRNIAGPCAPDLAGLLDDPNKILVRDVLEDLGTIGHVAVVAWPKIVTFLKNDDPEFRLAAADTLRRMGIVQAFPALREALNDSSEAVRHTAMMAIARLGEAAEPALPRFIELLEGKVPRTAQHVRQAFMLLGKFGKPALPALIPLLDEEDATLRQYSLQIIAAIGPAALPDLATALESSDNTRVQRGLLQTIGIIGPSGGPVLTTLGRLLKSEDPLLRRDAALALARAGEAGAASTPELLRLFDDPNKDVRIAAVTAVGSVARKEAGIVDKIARLTDDGDQAVAWAAIEAMGWKGHKAAVPLLLKLLKHEDEFTRVRAVRSLGAIGPEARNAMVELDRLVRTDPSRYVGPEALKVLNELQSGK